MRTSKSVRAKEGQQRRQRRYRASPKAKEIQARSSKAWRERNREYNKERNRLFRKQRKALVNALKLDVGCYVCGYNEYACALEFHHLDPFEKIKGVGALTDAKIKRLQEEIDKCVLLCANCHAVFEHTDAGVGARYG